MRRSATGGSAEMQDRSRLRDVISKSSAVAGRAEKRQPATYLCYLLRGNKRYGLKLHRLRSDSLLAWMFNAKLRRLN